MVINMARTNIYHLILDEPIGTYNINANLDKEKKIIYFSIGQGEVGEEEIMIGLWQEDAAKLRDKLSEVLDVSNN